MDIPGCIKTKAKLFKCLYKYLKSLKMSHSEKSIVEIKEKTKKT